MNANGDTAPAVNPHDHALVVGIRRYAGAPAGWPHDLRGPDNDAAAVAEWLIDPVGGGLPAANVHVISSAAAPDPFVDGHGLPSQTDVVGALKRFLDLPREYKDARLQFVGRRLYIFVSGHGWATRREQAAVVTAEAVKERAPNVDVTSWADYMAEAGAFKEIVLWADTCATRTDPTLVGGTPAEAGIRPVRHPTAHAVRMFEGFAAGIGLMAVENEMEDGQWHGAFTWTLLAALRGRARTPVTTDSLCDHLHNAMAQFQSDDDRERPGVAHEPAFGTRDPITFADPPRTTVAILILFPADCVGHQAVVTQAVGAAPIATTTLSEPWWRVSLEPGIYRVAAVDRALVFEAVRDAHVTVA